MNILAFFIDNGVPKTGLTPTIRIRDVADNTLIITDSTSSEVGDGWYKYDFIQYDPDKEYAIRFDGGPSLSNTDRYKSGTNDSYAEDTADAVWDEDLAGHIDAGSAGLIMSTLQNDVKRVLGLTHHNFYIDQTQYDDYGNMISARVRIYDNAGSVGTDNDVIESYLITADGTECGKFNYWTQVKL